MSRHHKNIVPFANVEAVATIDREMEMSLDEACTHATDYGFWAIPNGKFLLVSGCGHISTINEYTEGYIKTYEHAERAGFIHMYADNHLTTNPGEDYLSIRTGNYAAPEAIASVITMSRRWRISKLKGCVSCRPTDPKDIPAPEIDRAIVKYGCIDLPREAFIAKFLKPLREHSEHLENFTK